MDDKKKNCILMAVVGFNVGFMFWWLVMANSWFLGGLMSLIIGAILGGIAYKGTEFLT